MGLDPVNGELKFIETGTINPNDYGFITVYLAGFIRELRKDQYGDAIDKYFRLGKNLNQRDTIAVRRMVDGYFKLLYPDGEFTKEKVEEVLIISLEM